MASMSCTLPLRGSGLRLVTTHTYAEIFFLQFRADKAYHDRKVSQDDADREV